MPAGDAAPALELVLLGFGSVPRRFVELLSSQTEVLEARDGLRWRLVGLATARHGLALAPAGIDPARALRTPRDGSLSELHDPDAGARPRDTAELLDRVATARHGPRPVIVENTPLDPENGLPGVDHVRMALERGADVITANKGPAAFAYRELRDLAAAAGAAFLFEGTVLDGLPVFSLMREALPTVGIRGFRGIVNTTTNFLLSAMEEGRALEDALTEMQAAGVAEADPTNDVDGWDAAAKTAVLANVLMDADITPHDVDRRTLRSLAAADVRETRRRERHVKFVAAATRRDGRVVATARPEELPADDPLAALSGTAKGLVLDTDLLGEIRLSKTASGVAHTAYALLADLITIHRTRRR